MYIHVHVCIYTNVCYRNIYNACTDVHNSRVCVCVYLLMKLAMSTSHSLSFSPSFSLSLSPSPSLFLSLSLSFSLSRLSNTFINNIVYTCIYVRIYTLICNNPFKNYTCTWTLYNFGTAYMYTGIFRCLLHVKS